HRGSVAGGPVAFDRRRSQRRRDGGDPVRDGRLRDGGGFPPSVVDPCRGARAQCGARAPSRTVALRRATNLVGDRPARALAGRTWTAMDHGRKGQRTGRTVTETSHRRGRSDGAPSPPLSETISRP